MLKSLFVKDYALIANINVNFEEGLNIITGETGAGKSILIGALGLILGERASTETVRKGATKSIVEGVFDITGNSKIKKLLSENELDIFDEMIIRREISLKGANRCFINDTPVNLSLVKDIGYILVDLHGQHEHQSLLRTETHIDFLDELGSYDQLLKEYKHEYNALNKLKEELDDLLEREQSLKEKKDFYSFQLKEIDAVAPQPEEDDQIREQLNIMENSERLLELCTSVYDGLYDSDISVNDQLAKVRDEMEELSEIDKTFAEMEQELVSASAIVEEVTNFVRSYKSGIEIDPQKLDEMRERLGSLNILKKKFGGTLDKVIEYRESIEKEINLAEGFEQQIDEFRADIDAKSRVCGKIAGRVSDERKSLAETVSQKIVEALKYLGITNGIFKISVNNNEDEEGLEYKGRRYDYNSKGIDDVEFLISTNLGEDPKPLSKVASGGEISRIMLALKSILAKSDKLPLLIFDEIDTGISGRIAQKVGQSLKNLADAHQIIAITHLPQIAGLADYHYIVEKHTSDGRVTSLIRRLDPEEKVREVAKLISGEDVTEASLKGARELMGMTE